MKIEKTMKLLKAFGSLFLFAALFMVMDSSGSVLISSHFSLPADTSKPFDELTLEEENERIASLVIERLLEVANKIDLKIATESSTSETEKSVAWMIYLGGALVVISEFGAFFTCGKQRTK